MKKHLVTFGIILGLGVSPLQSLLFVQIAPENNNPSIDWRTVVQNPECPDEFDLLETWAYRKSVRKLIENYLRQEPTAGMSVAISVDGKIRFSKNWGFADIENQVKTDSRTVYRLASISKALTGVLAFKLQQDGLLKVNKPTRFYEPRLPKHHTHTLAQLLANRGKVRHYLPGDSLVAGTNSVFQTALEASALFSSDALTRDSYLYSTHGYTLVAAALEAATQKTFPVLVDEILSSPYGFKSLKCELPDSTVESRSKIYRYENGEFMPMTPLSLSWKYAGGGMECSAADLVRFGARLIEGKILDQPNLEKMIALPDEAEKYAHGWDIGEDLTGTFFAKSGGQPGARAYLRCYPAKKIVIVLLCNTSGKNIVRLGEEIAEVLAE